MKTIRWLRVKWPIPLSEVSKLLLSHQYSDETGRGFLLTSAGKNEIAGQFVEKISERKLTIDPFGNELESYITTYYVAKFKFDSDSNLLEMDTPPRSIRKLASELHSLLGLGLELSDIKVDPLLWLQELESSLSPVSVIHISAFGITVSISGLAKISVSGKKDIREDFSKLVGKKPRVINLVKFRGKFDDCSISADLSRSGSIKLSGHIYDGFKEQVRNCLESCLEK